MDSRPKLFISYCWGSQDHQKWVLQFADRLLSQGIDVILDKWHLKPGHDAAVFMERMIADPTVNKVVMLCDEMYSKKSNARAGGAGTEAQIITQKMYSASEQDKFVAVVCERDADGQPCVPIYYGSRIFIDFTDAANDNEEFQRLVRWAWDKPEYLRPEVGPIPAFLNPEPTDAKIASLAEFRRAKDLLRNGAPTATASVREYFDVLAAGMENFRIKYTESSANNFDDTVVKSIDEFFPYLHEGITLLNNAVKYGLNDEIVTVIHRFFERIIFYMYRQEGSGGYTEWDFDNYKFIITEYFMNFLAILIKSERFDAAANFLNEEFYWQSIHDLQKTMHDFTLFRTHTNTLEHRNKRLHLNRVSVRCDMMKERCARAGEDFNDLICVDLLLYLRSRNQVDKMWWPLVLHTVDRHGGALKIFSRAKSRKFFDRIAPLIGVSNRVEFGDLIDKINQDPNRIPGANFQTVNLRRLVGFDFISTLP